MASFTIPTIFKAIDRMTAPIRAMARSIDTFAGRANAAVNRADRAFRKFTPTISEAKKQFFEFATAASIAAAIVSGIHFSARSIMEYEKALASFRTIVSDATDKEFAAYKKSIADVATATGKSTIQVAQSFETIAGLNADFAKTADGLGLVSKAAITLAKAAGTEPQEAAANLVGIMNQFNLQAHESDRAINVLAAGQAAGAANIQQTSDAFVNFGSVAKGANMTLEESTALVQTLGKFSIFGAEAGTKLRGSVLKLQQAGVGYKSGQFKINDALLEAKARIDKLKTAKQKDAALTKMFGAENIATGRILLANIDTYNQYTAAVTGTTEAQKAAEINSNTLGNRLDELKNKWVNILTTSEETSTGLENVKRAVKFVTDNLETLVVILASVIGLFLAWKLLIIGTRAVLAVYNVVQGVSNALMGKGAMNLRKSAVAMTAYRVTTVLTTAAQWLWVGVMKAFRIVTLAATAAQWLLNVALTANPIGLIIVGVAALIGFVILIIKYWNQWGAVLSIFMGPLGLIISMIQSFRRNWDMIKKAFQEGGIVAGLKAIGKTLLDAVLQPLQKLFELAGKLPGKMGQWAREGAEGIQAMRERMGVNTTTDEEGNPIEPKPAVDPAGERQQALQEQITQTNNAKVQIDVKDPNNRTNARVKEGTGVQVNVASTRGF